METIGLALLGGMILILGELITVLAKASSIDKNNAHYKAGYEDGYEKGKKERESEEE